MSLSVVIAESGLGNHQLIPDGEIHRFTAPDDKPGSNNCWYVSFGSAGAFGSWKLGFTKKWHDGDLSSEDDLELARQIKAAQKQRANELIRVQKRTQEKARYLWASGSETIIHKYPESKQITPYGIRQLNNRLLVPMYYEGQLWNVQQITPDGAKRFLKRGRVKGCYMPIGALADEIYLCEGYATGCTLHEHTGNAVAVAFNAGNLARVAKDLRAKHPNIRLTIAADNDQFTPGNPGLVKARHAASITGADVIYPDFAGLEGKGTDFNDYVLAGGAL